MKTILVILTSILLVVGVMGIAIGAEYSVTASVTVPGVLSITADSMDFGSVSPGSTGTDSLNLIIDSNTDYDIKTKSSDADYFDKDSSADTTIEDSDLEWYDGVIPTWTGYTQTAVIIDSGNAGSSIAHNIDHKLTIPSNAEAGEYDLEITVSIVATP